MRLVGVYLKKLENLKEWGGHRPLLELKRTVKTTLQVNESSRPKLEHA